MSARASDPDALTLWIELVWNERTWRLALAPSMDRAIVVGSLETSDVHVAASGVAPMHFHLEREGSEVCLVSAYGAGVRVNAVAVRGTSHVANGAVIDFGVVRMVLRIHGALVTEDLPPGGEASQHSLRAGSDLATAETESAETSVLEIPGSVSNLAATVQINADELGAPNETFTMAPNRAVTLGRPVDANATEAITFDAPPPEPAWGLTEAHQQSALEENLGPPEVARAAARTRGPVGVGVEESSTLLESLGAGRRSNEGRGPSALARGLEQLGMLAKQRPIVVTALALGVALMVVLSLLGARAVLGSRTPRVAAPAEVHDRAEPKEPAADTRAPDPPVAKASAQANVAAAQEEEPRAPATAPPTARPKDASAVAAAVNHLRAGRHAEARAAYTELAEAHPEDAAYAAVARMLTLRVSTECSGQTPPIACPQVKP